MELFNHSTFQPFNLSLAPALLRLSVRPRILGVRVGPKSDLSRAGGDLRSGVALVLAVMVAPRHALAYHLHVDVHTIKPDSTEDASVLVALGVCHSHRLAADKRLEPGGGFGTERLARLRRVDVEKPNLVAYPLRVRNPDRVAVRDTGDDADNLAT